MTDAQSYDEGEYGVGSYGQLLWQIEQLQLAELINGLRATHATIELLDFATGTGRILSFVEPMVDRSVGIEISESMVERARSCVRRSSVLCRDITVPGCAVEDRYDIITAYRFLLNAEPELRVSALTALRHRLRDRSSVLVFNNHGNLFSHKAIMYPVHMSRRAGRHLASGNYLTHRQVLRLAERAGLRAQRVHGCGVFGGRAARLVPGERLLRWERVLATSAVSRLGVNQTYVARIA